jgi:SPP1 family predicted phage head-tail adaptor
VRGVNPGKYRHRIHIQSPVDEQNPMTGAITRSWRTLVVGGPLNSVPARALTGQGRETHAAGTKMAETTARFEFRWFPGLSEAYRILWDGGVYDIISIDRDETGRREYRVRCKGGLTDGS